MRCVWLIGGRARAGSFNWVESEIVHSALELDQLSVHAIMTPRPKIIWLNQDDPHELTWHKIVVSRHSDFPVYRGSRDNVVGVVAGEGALRQPRGRRRRAVQRTS